MVVAVVGDGHGSSIEDVVAVAVVAVRWGWLE